jgi:hypothetical protein
VRPFGCECLLEQGLTEVPAEGTLILVFTVSEINGGNPTQSRSLPSRWWLTAARDSQSKLPQRPPMARRKKEGKPVDLLPMRSHFLFHLPLVVFECVIFAFDPSSDFVGSMTGWCCRRAVVAAWWLFAPYCPHGAGFSFCEWCEKRLTVPSSLKMVCRCAGVCGGPRNSDPDLPSVRRTYAVGATR